MASFNRLEMAAALSMLEDIDVRKGFLGLSVKVSYRPTQSPVSASQYYYSPDQGERLKRLLAAPTGEMAVAAKAVGTLPKSPTGPYRLDVCQSADGQFAAVQAFSYADLLYHPLTEVRILKAEEAQAFLQLFS